MYPACLLIIVTGMALRPPEGTVWDRALARGASMGSAAARVVQCHLDLGAANANR